MGVVDLRLDSDTAIRWQVMRDLTDAPEDVVTAKNAGWPAHMLWRAPGTGRGARRRSGRRDCRLNRPHGHLTGRPVRI